MDNPETLRGPMGARARAVPSRPVPSVPGEQQQADSIVPSLRSVREIPASRSAPQTARERSEGEISALRAMPYEQYLQTAWWRGRRNLALRRAGYKCERCAAGRQLEVHHLSYERRGDEADEDLQVLCRGCHLGHHVNEVTPNRSVYLAVVSAALKVETFESVADLVEDVKRRCVALKLPYDHNQVQDAIARVNDARLQIQPPKKTVDLLDERTGNAPFSRAEAAGLMAKYGAIAKSMPHVHVVKSRREAEHRRALRMVLDAIAEQSACCDAAELAPRGEE